MTDTPDTIRRPGDIKPTAAGPRNLERIRACLAEAGYDPELAILNSDGAVGISVSIPSVVAWRAWAITAPEATACWECWDAHTGSTCDHPVDLSKGPRP